MGSDDFSVFLEYSRGVQFFVGSANNDPATKIGLHCGDNVFDESALSVGVSVFKPFVMGRKNWLFANTAGGAQASAVIYSLMETAKENSLDPYRYLLWILQNAPQLRMPHGLKSCFPQTLRKNVVCRKNKRPPSR